MVEVTGSSTYDIIDQLLDCACNLIKKEIDRSTVLARYYADSNEYTLYCTLLEACEDINNARYTVRDLAHLADDIGIL